MEQAGSGVKKGKPTWRPAAKLHVARKDPLYRFRWCDKDPANLLKKQAEGWEFAHAEHDHPGHVDDGTPLTSTTEYRELVLMKMPEELAQARNEYFQDRVNRDERELMRVAKGEIKKLHPDADAEGRMVIE